MNTDGEAMKEEPDFLTEGNEDNEGEARHELPGNKEDF
jgi:hypothetical protein